MPKASLASLTVAFSLIEAQGTGGTDRWVTGSVTAFFIIGQKCANWSFFFCGICRNFQWIRDLKAKIVSDRTFQRDRAHMPKASLASLTVAFSFIEAQGTGGTDRWVTGSVTPFFSIGREYANWSFLWHLSEFSMDSRFKGQNCLRCEWTPSRQILVVLLYRNSCAWTPFVSSVPYPVFVFLFAVVFFFSDWPCFTRKTRHSRQRSTLVWLG